MLRTVYHVVGFTQYMGTCKMHLFIDCPQLTKKRLAARQWDRTGVTETTQHDCEKRRRHVCKICLKRDEAGGVAPVAVPAGVRLFDNGQPAI